MLKHEQITHRIIGAFYEVYNTLGFGFLERVYQGAMAIEMSRRGLQCVPQAKIDVFYHEQKVGEYYADFLVEGCVIVELKACECLASEHEAQVINYLKATNIDVGMLLNFGKKAIHRRLVFEAARHQSGVAPISSGSDPRPSALESASSAYSFPQEPRS
jgi:GxxExxY protein